MQLGLRRLMLMDRNVLLKERRLVVKAWRRCTLRLSAPWHLTSRHILHLMVPLELVLEQSRRWRGAVLRRVRLR